MRFSNILHSASKESGIFVRYNRYNMQTKDGFVHYVQEMEGTMSINSVSNTQAAAAYQSYTKADKTADSKKTTDKTAESAVNQKGVIYEPNKEMIAKLKADANARTSQLQSLVEQLISKQGNAYGQANNIWRFLSGGKYTVDAATKAQAQADIAENGYWGVEQTSNRIVDFATALTGGDPGKVEEMRAAFEKGFKKAAKAWGGSLPDISQRTYDAVMAKFDKLAGVSETQE